MYRLLTAAIIGIGGFLASGCVHSQAESLPSATYGVRDDIQFYPAGPEYKLYNTQRAIEEYQASQAAGDDFRADGSDE